MISGVSVKFGGADHSLRLSTRAMRALENDFGKPIQEVGEVIEADFSINVLVRFFVHVVNNGDGGEEIDVENMIDGLGVVRMGELIPELFEDAFPGATEASKEGGTKNRKRAVKAK